MWYKLTPDDEIVAIGNLWDNPTIANEIKNQRVRKNLTILEFTNKLRDVIYKLNVSTVFLGISMAVKIGDPLLFETLITLETSLEKNFYVDRYDDQIVRYTTLQGARVGHDRIVGHIKDEIITETGLTANLNKFLLTL